MVALIVASMCVATLLTVGRTVAAEAQVQSRLEQAGSRRIEIDDVARKGFLSPAVVEVLAGYDAVEHVVGVTGPTAVVNSGIGRGGSDVPAWTIQGDLKAVAELVAGRWPGPGEAIVSEAVVDALGMDHPVGGLLVVDSGRRVSVVGAFRSRPGFDDFASGVLIRASPAAASDSLEIVASDAPSVRSVQSAALALLARGNPQDVNVESPVTLAGLQQDVLGDLRFSNRWLVLLVLGTGAVLTAIVVLGGVLMSRADLGRRRALGASRQTLTLLVVVRTTGIACVAVVVGTGIGIASSVIEDQQPDLRFTLAVSVLALLTAVAASVVPAVIAAWQDPLRVLRTP